MPRLLGSRRVFPSGYFPLPFICSSTSRINRRSCRCARRGRPRSRSESVPSSMAGCLRRRHDRALASSARHGDGARPRATYIVSLPRRIRIRAESRNLSWPDRVSAPSSASRLECANRLESQAGRASSAYSRRFRVLTQTDSGGLSAGAPVIRTSTLVRDGDDVHGFSLGAIDRRKREATHGCSAEVVPAEEPTTMTNLADICSGLLSSVIPCAKYA